MKQISILTLLISMFFYQVNAQSAIEWNLNSTYGVTQSGFASIISDAKTHFVSFPNDIITVTIDAGTYNIGGNGSHGINVGGVQPGVNGRLIFKGAGMYATSLIFTEDKQRMISGNNVYRVTFQDMHMGRDKYTVTQGYVVSKAAGELVLELQEGFPTPLELFDDTFPQGRYFKKYTDSATDPQLIQTNNDQVSWGYRNPNYVLPELISGTTWRFYLNSATKLVDYNVGDFIGVKSKKTGEIYWFSGGGEVVFENIRWTESSRGLARGGFSNLTIRGCRVDRGAPINGRMPCMSTPSGGFQMNQDGDSVSTNMVVENCYIDSPGDDNVAFFHVDGGIVKNTVVRNGFARGVLATDMASNICLDNVTLENAYIRDEPILTNHYSVQDAITAGGAYNANCVSTGIVNVTGVNVSPSSADLEPNQNIQLTATISPSDATNQSVSWGSDNTFVATVDANGFVTANNVGTATITVTTLDGGFIATSTITVVSLPPTVTLHVSSIIEGTQNASKGKKFGLATVTVVDNLGNPVSGATVYGTFSGDFNESRSGTTGVNGTVNVVTTTSIKGALNFNFCVDNIVHSSITYNSADNIVTCSDDQVSAKISSSTELSSDINTLVYPNPVDTKLNISGFDKDLPLEIYNTLGMLVKRISYEDTIDVSKLTQGLYILKQKELTAKFLKK